MRRFLVCFSVLWFSWQVASAQEQPDLNGFKPYGAYDGSGIDSVNLQTGNLIMHIPVPVLYPQRGGKLNLTWLLSANSNNWSCVTFSTTCRWQLPAGGTKSVESIGSGIGLDHSLDMAVHRVRHLSTTDEDVGSYFIRTSDGNAHQLVDTAGNHRSFDAIDTSGWHVELSGADSFGNATTGLVVDRAGNRYQLNTFFGLGQSNGCPPATGCETTYTEYAKPSTVTDANGNIFSLNTSNSDFSSYKDTMGRPHPGFASVSSDSTDCVLSGQQFSSAVTYPFTGFGGTGLQLKFCYATIPYSTAFSTPTNAIQGTGSSTQLATVIMPDKTKWVFAYDTYANVSSIGLPLGGSISYTWTEIPNRDCVGGRRDPHRAVATRTLNDNEGHSYQWSYHYATGTACPFTNSVTDPLLNDTDHVFTALFPDQIFETSTVNYQGTGSGRKTLEKTDTGYYQSTIAGIDAFGHSAPALGNVVPNSITTTVYPSLNVKQTLKTRDSGPGNGRPIYGVTIAEKEYDWGLGGPGALLRETDNVYLWQTADGLGNHPYALANLIDLPASTAVISPSVSANMKSSCPVNAVGGTAACMTETDYSYDEPGYSQGYTGSLPIGTHGTAPNPTPIRGNQTSVSRWLSTTSGFVVEHTNWYDIGERYKTIDPLNHTVTFTYDSTYAGAYVTQTCPPTTAGVTHCVSGTYDFTTGLLTAFTDQNGATSNYGYDIFGRLTSGQEPADPTNGNNRPNISFTFPTTVSFPFTFTRQKSITSSLSDSVTTLLDGLGRPYKTQHAVPGNTAVVDATFDAFDHVGTVSNPYFTTSDSTYGNITNLYDGLDRVTQSTKQDGSISKMAYDVVVSGAVGNCTLATDEAGNARSGCSDALGRLIEVDEPGGPDPGTQATASVTISGAFNSTWVGAGTPHLAATGTAIASVSMSDGSSHDFYFDTNQHLCQMSWFSGSGWYDQDLTSMTEAALPLAGSSIAAVALGSVIHVFYQGANQHIYDMNWTGSIWQNLDMTVLTGASPVSNTKMAIVATGSSNTPMMFYEGTNQHLFCIYWNAPTTTWLNADLHSLSGATNLIAPNGAISAAMWGTTGNIHALFLDTNQNLNRIVWSGTAWITNNLTSITGAALAVPGSKLTTIPTGTSIDLMTFYEGAGQHIYSIYWNNSAGTYQALDFTVWSGATNIAAVLTSLANNPVGPHMFYLSSNQHLYDMLWNGSAWVNADLTSLANTTAVPASGSSLSSHGTAGGNTYNIFFAGGNQHIYHTYFSPSTSAWFNEDPLVAASNFVVDSGTVSLTIPNGGSNFTATVCYGVSTNPICAGQPVNASPVAIANALAAVLNGAGSPVNATVTGATLSLTWRTTGVVTTTVAPMTSTSDNPAVFPNGSFTSTSGTFSGGIAPSNQSLRNPFVTQYQYDALGNLLHVDQKGTAPSDSTQWRTRTFTYDSLSRLLTANNPESGTITYSYDADGNLLQKTSPAPNQTGSATQTVSYCYDELHRVTGKGYGAQSCPLATPVVTYVYDSGTNAKGHLTSLTDQAGTASYTYDVLGRLTAETRPIAAVSKSTIYTYNLDGSVKTLTYPSGRVVTYTPDSAGRLVSAVDGNGTNYATSASYNPDGSLKSLLNGSTPALNQNFQYTPRLQLCRITTLTSGTVPTSCTDSHIGNIMDRGYDFHAGNGTAGSGTDNGNVFAITNYRDTTRSQAFTYDALNRLTSGWSSANTGTYSWGENYSIDAWGNLQISPMGGKAHGGNFTLSGNAQNRPTGLAYDAAGNLMSYLSATYTYDQENRLSSTAGMSYTYDGNGDRVLKSNTSTGAAVKRYWSMGGNTLAEGDGTGNLTAEYVYFGGKRIVRIDLPANTVHYYLSDHLGSTSIVASAAGTVEEESDYSPFGTEVVVTGPGVNELKFTGKRRDAESQLDYFGARYYSNIFGRFSSTDPVTATPEHVVNPQRWNAYTYGMNNPLFYVDPNGRDAIAVNFLNAVPLGGHEGLIVVNSDGSATYARFGPKGGNKPFGPGQVDTQSLKPVQFKADGLPTDASYKQLADEVGKIEGEPAGDVGFNYFKTSETDTVLLQDWIRRIKEASDKGQVPDYDATRNNCATFCVIGLIAGHAIKENQPVNFTPNRLFMILSPLATDNYPKTVWKPRPPKEKVTHKFKLPCGEKGQSKC